MPIYEYRCDNGHTFEVMQRMSDDPVSACQTCEAPVQRVFHPVAVHFKGSGFYNTDYGTRKRAREKESSSSESSSETKRSDSNRSDSNRSDSKGSDSKGSDSTASSKSETKSDSKTATKSSD